MKILTHFERSKRYIDFAEMRRNFDGSMIASNKLERRASKIALKN